MKNAEKIGGIAALGHAAALVVGMVLSFTWMYPLLDAAPDQASRFLAGNQAIASLWILIVDWGSAVTLVIMLLALYQRMKAGWPVFMHAAVVFGFLWAGLTIGNNNLMLHNFGVVANLSGSFPAQAAAWTVLVRSVWVLLFSLTAVRAGRPFHSPGLLGVFLGIVGSLTPIHAVAEPMFMIFGPGMMVCVGRNRHAAQDSCFRV